MADIAELGIKVDSSQTVKADKALDGLAASANKADDSVGRLTTEVKKGATANKGYAASTSTAAKNTGRLQNQAQNASFQIADLAVQLEGGTSFARAFGQQGSQLLGALGPYGAIAGAAVAVTAALASTFFDAGNSAEELAEKINDLTEDYGDLTEAQRLFLANEQNDKIQKQAQKIAGLADQYRDLQDEIKSVESGRLGVGGNQFAVDPEGKKRQQVARLTRELEKLDAELDTENKVIADLRDELIQITGTYKDVGDTINNKTLNPAERLVESLTNQAATLGLTSSEAKLYALALTEGVTPALIEEAEAAQKTIDAYNAKAAAQKKAEQEAARAAAEQDRINARAQSIAESLLSEEDQIRLSYDRRREIINKSTLLSAMEKAEIVTELNEAQAQASIANALFVSESIIGITQNQVQQIGSLMQEGSAIGRAFFVVSQGLAAAGAVIDGLQAGMAIRLAYAELAAATATPALIGAGEVHANIAVAAGVATAGLITGQTIASFDGGGFTGFGSRTGGLDGKGGFMAMVHPNETVIDHTKGGQSSGMVVNIQNYSGGEVTARQTPQGVDVIVGKVQEAIGNNISRGVGPVTKSMQNTYGLKRSGTA